MRIIFAGTPEIAVPTLKKLLEKHEVLLVITKFDQPQGRGKKIVFNPVKMAALDANIQIYQPNTLKDVETFEKLRVLSPDVLVNVACGFFIPDDILNLPKKGCINLHPSLLPRWRGAAPLQRALLAGDVDTGISIMQMDSGWDTGNLWAQIKFPILPKDTSKSLFDKAGKIGSELMIKVLDNLDNLRMREQQGEVCYADKLTKEEGKINWKQSAIVIDRQVRGMNPWPVAFTFFKNKLLRIWEVELLDDEERFGQPGFFKWTDGILKVSTLDYNLRICKIQPEGGRIISAESWINGLNYRKQISKFDDN